MAARLGNVLYWLGCVVGAIFLAVLGFVAINPGEGAALWMLIYALLAVSAWLLGRAIRYILAGT